MISIEVEHYEIRVRERLDSHWGAWFEGLTLTPLANGETLIAGPIQDQAALHGILAKVRDMGLYLVSVALMPDADSGEARRKEVSNMQTNPGKQTTTGIAGRASPAKEVMMTERRKRPLRRRMQARLMSVLNRPVRVLLQLPFPTPLSGRLMLLSYTGRKSGKAYQQPVSYVQQGDTLLTPGGGNWKWNMRDGRPVHIRLRGRDVLARPELIQDLDEIERTLKVMMAVNPGVSAFVGIPKGPDGRLDRSRLEDAVSHGFRIVRWHLGEEAR